MKENRNATDELIDSIMRLKEKPLPQRVRIKAQECMIDYIGAAYAGAHANRG